jgi:hypothetical protein
MATARGLLRRRVPMPGSLGRIVTDVNRGSIFSRQNN